MIPGKSSTYMYPSDHRHIVFQPLETANKEALVALFGKNGACGGCWCMYYRLTKKDYEAGKGDVNRDHLMLLVNDGKPLGILAFDQDFPVGWCSISPRASLPRMRTARYFKPVDDRDVWSITCLFIKPTHRRKGLSQRLIKAACKYAMSLGAKVIEAYPIVSEKNVPSTFAWPGFDTAFKEAGFKTVRRPSETRQYMRYYAP